MILLHTFKIKPLSLPPVSLTEEEAAMRELRSSNRVIFRLDDDEGEYDGSNSTTVVLMAASESCFPSRNASSPVGLRILLNSCEEREGGVVGKALLGRGRMAKHGRRYTAMVPQKLNFLQVCRLCGKKLRDDKDIYMYRGNQAFCSVDCRGRQILVDEIKEKEKETSVVRKRVSLSLHCKSIETQKEPKCSRGIPAIS